MIANPYILFRRITNPSVHYSCGFYSQALRLHLDSSLFVLHSSLKYMLLLLQMTIPFKAYVFFRYAQGTSP